jgi:hypothetical protein
MSKEWINNCGDIRLSKKNELYIKIKKPLSLKEGDTLLLTKFADHLDGLVKAGIVKEDDAENQKESQHFVKYILTKTPSDS